LAVRPSERQANARELLSELERALPRAYFRPIEGLLETSIDGGYSATDRRAIAEAARESPRQAPRERGHRLRVAGVLLVAGAIGASVLALRSPAPNVLVSATEASAGVSKCSNAQCAAEL